MATITAEVRDGDGGRDQWSPMGIAAVGFIGYAVIFFIRNFTDAFLELGIGPGQVDVGRDAIRDFSPSLYHYIGHLHIAVSGFIAATGVAVPFSYSYARRQPGRARRRRSWDCWWRFPITTRTTSTLGLGLIYLMTAYLRRGALWGWRVLSARVDDGGGLRCSARARRPRGRLARDSIGRPHDEPTCTPALIGTAPCAAPHASKPMCTAPASEPPRSINQASHERLVEKHSLTFTGSLVGVGMRVSFPGGSDWRVGATPPSLPR
jgi:hypothetical protein